ncbi:carbohydrate kinase family protein [Candidatus Galacturonibacter soehngenii]|uniref:Carbohydrate kinase n=1 Tax=Candidatus Galacturonatibacter soehngenii TaxID=2307010 RepID=A0A7V7QKX8_9FIRM|nr:carbohydrate kinase [Candidatus Galacturonibacter soehngenii]KAB1438519.1 carbohydrate kinase [Candidatus Galacturonibacter soehngenii]
MNKNELHKRPYDVIALGELLIDFTIYGKSMQGNSLFEANAGGAPCNVLAMLTKLGRKTAFIGKVGNDIFGHMLKKKVSNLGIDTQVLVIDEEIPTTLAFIQNKENGEREFSFYRKPGADMMLKENEIEEEIFTKAKIFHFGTISMTDEGVRKATQKAINAALKNECIITFDPNLRLNLWSDKVKAKEAMHYGLSKCHVLKISDNEIEFLLDTSDTKEGIKMLHKKYPDIKLILATMGIDGSYAYYKEQFVFQKAFIQSNTIDCTGAGDTFNGIAIHYILEYGLDNLNEKKLKELLCHAGAGGAIITTRPGALCAMPDKKEINILIKKQI